MATPPRQLPTPQLCPLQLLIVQRLLLELHADARAGLSDDAEHLLLARADNAFFAYDSPSQRRHARAKLADQLLSAIVCATCSGSCLGQ